MERAARWIVRNRKPILIALLCLSALLGVVSLGVPINADMTKYLPEDSRMKRGIDVLAEEFSGLSMPATIRVMFENLPEEEERAALETLRSLPHVSSAARTGRKEAEGNRYLLFTVSMDAEYRTKEALELERAIPAAFPERKPVVLNDDKNGMEIPLFIYAVALAVLLAVLFILCSSWAEPLIFLFVIGAAILMNMGTNGILGSVSVTTYSMSAILQLVLSMDYSIILMNRFRQEKAREPDPEKAMARAIARALPSIAGSGFTTIVGLLTLVFMRFRIGADLGLVLAKGVCLSMLCCLTLLPAVILFLWKWIERTGKRTPRLPTKTLARFNYRFRRALAVGFVLLFAGAWYMNSLSDISYSLNQRDPIAEIFPEENQIVMLTSNQDADAAAEIASAMEEEPGVTSVYAWSTTMGKERTPSEMAEWLRSMLGDGGTFAAMAGERTEGMIPAGWEERLNEETLRSLYSLAGMSDGRGDVERMSPEELASFLGRFASNPLMGALAGEDMAAALGRMDGMMDSVRGLLIGPEHSLTMISATLPVEGEETSRFLESLEDRLGREMSGDWYLIGNSVMNQEMKRSFGGELLTITLLTAAAIFLVVLFSFRNLAVPVILVSLVQCGVFLAVSTTWLLGYKMYYLALLIVQCILMGATVDYGILFANIYRERRGSAGIRQALEEACDQAMYTILTSSLFMIFGTGAIGVSPADPTIAQICQSISIGACAAMLLVIFVLPGLLAALDRMVIPKNRKGKEDT